MARTQTFSSFLQELAEFLAAQPSSRQLLDYRPPKSLQRRCTELLEKQNLGEVSFEERQELEEYAFADRLMRLIKARLRSQQGKS